MADATSMMGRPSWKQFAAIPFDATVAAVIRALAVEVPPEGRPKHFHAHGWHATRTPDGNWSICDGQTARFVAGPAEVLREMKLPQGTPSGDALRQWLRWWGWVPKSEQSAAEPQDATRMVT